MTNQNLPMQKSKKGLIIGIAFGIVLLIFICIIAFIGTIAYWQWTTNVNS